MISNSNWLYYMSNYACLYTIRYEKGKGRFLYSIRTSKIYLQWYDTEEITTFDFKKGIINKKYLHIINNSCTEVILICFTLTG